MVKIDTPTLEKRFREYKKKTNARLDALEEALLKKKKRKPRKKKDDTEDETAWFFKGCIEHWFRVVSRTVHDVQNRFVLFLRIRQFFPGRLDTVFIDEVVVA